MIVYAKKRDGLEEWVQVGFVQLWDGDRTLKVADSLRTPLTELGTLELVDYEAIVLMTEQGSMLRRIK